jgi:glucokinase
MDSRRVPVLEIGGTHVTAALVDAGTWRVVPDTGGRSALDARGTVDEIVATLVEAAVALQPADGSLWGVAIPGPFDYARGVANFHGVSKFDALRGLDLGDVLRRMLTGGTGKVHFVNDAEAFAVGEWVAGAANGHERAVGVTLGTGIGSAFLADGLAQSRGPGVPPQGRLDLLEVAGRPLEESVSRRAIRTHYAALAGEGATGRLDVREIATRARAGDAAASRAIDETLRVLGRVLAPRAVDFGASIVVVGGSIALAWDVIDRPLRTGMDEGSPAWSNSFEVAPAQRIEEAALLGAAWRALQTSRCRHAEDDDQDEKVPSTRGRHDDRRAVQRPARGRDRR